MNEGFFAMVSRMKYISRWALMRNTVSENISEHSHQVACIAHVLAVIGNKRFGKNYNAERAAFLGLYHDMPEILTGDMPTPVKYFSEETKKAYQTVEASACRRLLDMLPEDLRDEYAPAFFRKAEDEELWRLVKAADRLGALIKCIEEEGAGNKDFSEAKKTVEKALDSCDLPEVRVFKEEFLPSVSLTLDEQ